MIRTSNILLGGVTLFAFGPNIKYYVHFKEKGARVLQDVSFGQITMTIELTRQYTQHWGVLDGASCGYTDM